MCKNNIYIYKLLGIRDIFSPIILNYRHILVILSIVSLYFFRFLGIYYTTRLNHFLTT